ncbi:MAG: hypothetical protein A2V88_17965 [Elusimicrobia bacterium RBG_16_66_12]|nr:MAG: hypothetical protein A2V88_17965 [Elusimicrobia bacterium RBG_16_66_12]
MLKILADGAIQECPLPDLPRVSSRHTYPVYHKAIPAGMLVVNSFTDEVCVVDRADLEAIGQAGVLSRLAEGPLPEVLIQDADRSAAKIKASLPFEIAFCPTYSCNLRCTYCFQQTDPLLDKRVISKENLAKFLAYVDAQVLQARASDPKRAVVLQLFGGEPFTLATKPVISEIFDYCRSRKIHVAATTNGTGIGDFLDILLPYHGYIAKVGITIDGVGRFHDSRRKRLDGQGTFDKIVQNVNILIRAGIKVMTSLTLDRSSIAQANAFFDFARTQGWIDNPCVELSVARVDDRKFETGYAAVMSESELLKEMLDLNARARLPGNVRFAFLKTSFDLAKRFRCAFNQNEVGRERFRYCWASSRINDIVYVDSALDVYRCTYTPGDKKFKAGSLDGGFSLSAWHSHGTWGREECGDCPIGGYCAGGCKLSTQADFKRNCADEKRNFENLIENVIGPRLPAVTRDQDR